MNYKLFTVIHVHSDEGSCMSKEVTVVSDASDDDNSQSNMWLPQLFLTQSDKEILMSDSSWLNDRLINAAQTLLKRQFHNSGVEGFQCSLLGQKLKFKAVDQEMVQIIHTGSNHWCCISTLSCEKATIDIYDSLSQFLPQQAIAQCASIVYTQSTTLSLSFHNVQKQNNGNICGLFAIAFATTLCNGDDPVKKIYAQNEMRSHFLKCLETERMVPFPSTNKKKSADSIVSKEVPIFCNCRMPENPRRRMIQCTSCKEWYHDECETISKSIWKLRSPQWKCSKCS